MTKKWRKLIMDEAEIDKIIEFKEVKRKQDIKDLEKLQETLNLPFYQQLQQEGNLERLQTFEADQRNAFEHTIRKHNPELKPDWLEMFSHYMTEFLHGEVKNIHDWKEKQGIKATKNERDWGAKLSVKEIEE